MLKPYARKLSLLEMRLQSAEVTAAMLKRAAKRACLSRAPGRPKLVEIAAELIAAERAQTILQERISELKRKESDAFYKALGQASRKAKNS